MTGAYSNQPYAGQGGDAYVQRVLAGEQTPTWRKLPDIWPAGMVGGDDQITEGWNVRYVLDNEPDDGLHALIDENYYVERLEGEESPRYVVTCQTLYSVCLDLNDPGGTEVYAEYEYDKDADVLIYEDLTAAEQSTRRLAEADCADMYLWDGRTSVEFGNRTPYRITP